MAAATIIKGTTARIPIQRGILSTFQYTYITDNAAIIAIAYSPSVFLDAKTIAVANNQQVAFMIAAQESIINGNNKIGRPSIFRKYLHSFLSNLESDHRRNATLSLSLLSPILRIGYVSDVREMQIIPDITHLWFADLS
jgi:hypothetical protein